MKKKILIVFGSVIVVGLVASAMNAPRNIIASILLFGMVGAAVWTLRAFKNHYGE